MFGRLDSQCDIWAYLTPEDVEKIQSEKIEGILIYAHNPKRQGKIIISVNEEKRNQNGFGIGVDLKNDFSINNKIDLGTVELFVGDYYYQRIIEGIGAGTRYGHAGSKVNIDDISKISSIDKTNVELLLYYAENRDKLLVDFD